MSGDTLMIPTAMGNIAATPTKDGKVQLKDQKGQTETIEMAEFKQFLAQNATKPNNEDSISFNGQKNIVAPKEDPSQQKAKEASSNSLIKFGAAVVVTGVAIWQRKNIMKYAGKAWEAIKGVFQKPKSQIEQTKNIILSGLEANTKPKNKQQINEFKDYLLKGLS